MAQAYGHQFDVLQDWLTILHLSHTEHSNQNPALTELATRPARRRLLRRLG
jgi:hypothetical protein